MGCRPPLQSWLNAPELRCFCTSSSFSPRHGLRTCLDLRCGGKSGLLPLLLLLSVAILPSNSVISRRDCDGGGRGRRSGERMMQQATTRATLHITSLKVVRSTGRFTIDSAARPLAVHVSANSGNPPLFAKDPALGTVE